MERIVDIATDGQHVRLYRGFLLVERDGTEVGRVPLDDVHALIIHAHGVTWSGAVVAALAERDAPMVFCGSNHSPVAVTLPIKNCRPTAAARDPAWR